MQPSTTYQNNEKKKKWKKHITHRKEILKRLQNKNFKGEVHVDFHLGKTLIEIN